MSDAEEPEMSGEVRHIEQGIILTELIQIEPHDTITRHHDVLCRKTARGGPGYPLSEGAAALPDADQEIGEEAFALGKDLDQLRHPTRQRMDVAAQRVLAAGRQAAPMQAEQPRRGLLHPLTGIGRGEELRPPPVARRPLPPEPPIDRNLSDGAGDGGTP